MLSNIARKSIFQSSSSSMTKTIVLRRNLAAHGHGHEKPKYEGMEAVVRKYLPENHHIVLGVLGAYAGLYFTFKAVKAMSGGKKKELEALGSHSSHDAPAPVSSIPSVISDKFEAWINVPGNQAKWEASIATWEKDMEKPAAAAKWEKSLA